MKTIAEITCEFCGGEPPRPISELCDAKVAVSRMIELRKKLGLMEEDLLELSACCGIGVVACWRINYKFCRDEGISKTKLSQDGAMWAMLSEEGTMIKIWAEEHLPKVLAEVDACESEEEGARLWLAYCEAAYRYGMALEQQIMDMEYTAPSL